MNWEIYNLRGPRDQVRALVQANTKLNDGSRAGLLAQIDALPAECFAISVNGYCQTHAVGRDVVCNLNVTVSGMK